MSAATLGGVGQRHSPYCEAPPFPQFLGEFPKLGGRDANGRMQSGLSVVGGGGQRWPAK